MTQAGADRPVLLFRVDRGTWRAVWPLAALLTPLAGAGWPDYAWTAQTGIEAWAAVARELADAGRGAVP